MTSENVAAKYNVSREVQDNFAARSHAKADAARSAGRFRDEIVPVQTISKVCVGSSMRDQDPWLLLTGKILLDR